MTHLISDSIKLVLIVVYLLNLTKLFGQSEELKQRLPSIWGDKQDGRGELVLSYRFLSEIQLFESQKTYLIEEWAWSTKQVWRMDIIEYPSGKRTSYLADRTTGEKFRFEPFSCELIKSFNDSYSPELKDKFPELVAFVPSGIGALWLHALELEVSYSNATEYLPEYGVKKSSRSVYKCFAKFSVLSTNDYKHSIIFYFRDTKLHNPESLTLINVGRQNDKLLDIKMRIKMLEIETPWSLVGRSSSSTTSYQDNIDNIDMVFSLPVGYGCRRAERFEHPFSVPPNTLASRIEPHVLQLSVVALQPISMDYNLERWKSHTSSIRMITGRINLSNEFKRDYLILVKQDYKLANESPKMYGTELRRATLRRIKRVWDLGNEALSSLSSSSSSSHDQVQPNEQTKTTLPTNNNNNNNNNNIKEPAVYFEIDEHTGKCLGYGESKLDAESGSVEFPLVTLRKPFGLKPDYANEVPSTVLNLSTELIRMLFASSEGYHLIKEHRSIIHTKSTEYIYERRIDLFEITNGEGKIVWRGPLSIIRKHTLYDDSDERNLYMMTAEHHVSVTIQFMSKNLDSIVTKIHLNVEEAHKIDQASFHRELNVGPCFGRLLRTGSGQQQQQQYFLRTSQRATKTNDLQFVVNYPLESDEIGDRLWIYEYTESMLYDAFLRSMVAVSSGQLDLMQLVNINIDIGIDQVKISGKLVDRPSLFSYIQETIGQKFAISQRDRVFREFKMNEEKCAESCDNYNCPMFVYCLDTRACDLLTVPKRRRRPSGSNSSSSSSGPAAAAIALEADPNCSLFKARPMVMMSSTDNLGPRENLGGRHMKPRQLVEKIRQLILNQSELDLKKSLLSIETQYRAEDGSEKKLILVPISIESGAFTANQLDDLIGEASTLAQPNKQNYTYTYAYDGSSSTSMQMPMIIPEYLLVMEHKQFKVPSSKLSAQFPIQLARHMSYEECESLCAQMDCHSFSHCQIEQTCLVSQLHQTNEIEANTEQGDFCFVMARDYLTKFSKTNQVSELTKEAEQKSCHLRSSHLYSGKQVVLEPSNPNAAGEINSTSSSDTQKLVCDLYIRSYLGEFDRFNGKSLPDGNNNDQDESNHIVVIKGFGAENCALECVERAEGTCGAFHVCRPNTKSSGAEPSCALFSSVSSQQQQQTGGGQLTYLTNDDNGQLLLLLLDNPKCSTFILSRSSELRSLITVQQEGKHNGSTSTGHTQWTNNDQYTSDAPQISNPEEGESSSSSSSSHWFAKLALALVGLGIGYVLAAHWLNKFPPSSY